MCIRDRGITNILLLGTDGRENEDKYRSDAMMILTIDTIHNDICLLYTSWFRTFWSNVPDTFIGKS